MDLVERAVNLVDGKQTVTEASVKVDPSKARSDAEKTVINGLRSGVDSIQQWVEDAQRTLREATKEMPGMMPTRTEDELTSMKMALEKAERSLDDASSNVRAGSHSAAWDALDDVYRRLDQAVDAYQQAMERLEGVVDDLDGIRAAKKAYAALLSTISAQMETEEVMAMITDRHM